jgi:hypothetical protein
MSWFDRQKEQLDLDLKNGSITQAEYNSALTGVQGR